MADEKRRLTQVDHDRGSTGMTYVYAVNSRRAGGVSVGVNLNPNAQCNWRCIYCQVPGLSAGKGPPIDLAQLQRELATVLRDIADGTLFEDRVHQELRVLKDVAFSGDGESTTSPSFAGAVDAVIATMKAGGVLGDVPITLISNGSMLDKTVVQDAVQRLGENGGRVWFKLDRATREGMQAVNDRGLDIEHHLRRLRWVAPRAETWIQTCVFALDGASPSDEEREAYLSMVRDLSREEVPVRGVLLYGLARPSMQVEAPRLSRLPEAWLTDFAAEIETAGLPVRVSP